MQLLDYLPEGVSQAAEDVWSVLACSLGEQGGNGRTALAWRWALTGACSSPVSLGEPPGRPPGRSELVAEADVKAQLGRSVADPGGQVMHARFVLRWLAGELDGLPLWNGGPEELHVTDGADFAHAQAEIGDVYTWAMLAEWRHPWPDGQAAAAARAASGWARGTVHLLDWVRGETAEGPLTGRQCGSGRPSLYEVALEVRSAAAALGQARRNGSEAVAARIEAIMETFAWFAGWSRIPPVDRHGHLMTEECAERDADCVCDRAGSCLRAACPACRRTECVLGFSQVSSA